MEDNCIMANERKNFEKMKNEHIKLTADYNILKEDMQEMMMNYHNIARRLNALEEENTNLRSHNKNLVKFVSKNTTGGREPYPDYNEQQEYYDPRVNRTNDYINNDFTNFNTIHNTSSVEMNHILQNNQDKHSHRGRFLIPKNNY
jgi:predicted patatin/cPLA2 family phospholipase